MDRVKAPATYFFWDCFFPRPAHNWWLRFPSVLSGISCPAGSPRNKACPSCSRVWHGWSTEAAKDYSHYDLAWAAAALDHYLTVSVAAGGTLADSLSLQSSAAGTSPTGFFSVDAALVDWRLQSASRFSPPDCAL